MASNFQIETQERLNWCWAAVAASVSNYFFPGRALSQCAIATSVLNAKNGQNANCCDRGAASACDALEALEDALDVVKKLRGASLTYQRLDAPMEFEKVCKQIDDGLPVCARIQWYGEEERGHFVMIVGYSESQSGEPWVDIADPYFEDSTVPYKQFCSAYWGVGQWSDAYLVSQA